MAPIASGPAFTLPALDTRGAPEILNATFGRAAIVSGAALSRRLHGNGSRRGGPFALETCGSARGIEYVEKPFVCGLRTRIGPFRDHLTQVSRGQLDVGPLPVGVHVRATVIRSQSLGPPSGTTWIDEAWDVVLAAAEEAEHLAATLEPAAFALAHGGRLRRVAEGAADAVVVWRSADGWTTTLATSDPRRALIDLYLPVCSATNARPITVGHLGQSLDGFIATHAGESQYVTGEENIKHLHRMRALCDAVIVGAGTVAADDPQLTTRHVSGPSPVRVVLDPTRRLADHYRVFNDDSADTLYVCARSLAREGETHFGRASVVAVDDCADGIDVTAVQHVLRARGCHRIFVEGGGVTVSMFLEANLLDRLQIAIAPLLIGDGRPAIRLSPRMALSDCHRPRYRVFRMGADVLFDCELGSDASDTDTPSNEPPITRVI